MVYGKMFYFIILTHFYYDCLADVMPYCVIGRCFCLADGVFLFWNVADVIAKRKMLSSYFLFWLADVIAIFLWKMLYHFFHYVTTHYIGWCYCQVADGIATYYYYYCVMADVIVSARWKSHNFLCDGRCILSPGRCYSQGEFELFALYMGRLWWYFICLSKDYKNNCHMGNKQYLIRNFGGKTYASCSLIYKL